MRFSNLFRQLTLDARNRLQHRSLLALSFSLMDAASGRSLTAPILLKRRSITVSSQEAKDATASSPLAIEEDTNVNREEHRQEQATPQLSLRSHLYILGSGSIGLFLASTIRSRHPEYPLTLLLRDHHAPRLVQAANTKGEEYPHINISLNQQGCDTDVRAPARLVSRFGLSSAANGKKEQGEEWGKEVPLAKEEKIELVLLTTKAFQAVNALKSVQTHLAPNCRIVVLCNGGLAVRDELKLAFPDNLVGTANTLGFVKPGNDAWNVELASITHGAYQEKPIGDSSGHGYRVIHAGVGKLFLVSSLEETQDDASSLLSQQILEDAGLNPKFVSQQEMENILWYKLAANCFCNPLTAIHQCTNGLLHEKVDDFDTVLEKVVEEVCAVHGHCTLSITEASSDGNNDMKTHVANNNSSTARSTLDPVRVTEFVRQVIHDNVDNHSSMQQDVYHQRRTEIEFLNGYIVRSGMQFGFDCPVNRELRDRVVAIEATYAS